MRSHTQTQLPGSSAVHGTPPVLVGRGLIKTYDTQRALDGVNIEIGAGDAVAIVGPSGSGKSTLLHVLAGILPSDAGEVLLAGRRIDQLGEGPRSELRRTQFGFVFQSGMLVAELTAQENAALPLLLGGASRSSAMAAALEWLDKLGLAGKEKRLPGQLSGGEAQRVAIARALAHRPSVIFADEPTGALDTRTGAETMRALLDAAAETNAAVVVVTHDTDIAESMPRTVSMRDGRVQL
ncbi:ABC transporter ATP-binding protein [Saccharomonospora xinjiangensis]|uniref:ABC-type antimicrobial peptide transport system, ATPase component n=1 Tax=Saccharomonospora xinjiangensis XJ-54 TaxID=882086 RepID=I0V2M6_9PSEU|nr:ABC transporter ATP-binding protein [Saccharomonospora xinjiangensis]EID54379.1 ABC-type antimicrobial peptide transport system, ATPase component [Saccharomonospora xinjiangensis XJ-54]